MGDFNHPEIDWQTSSTKTTENHQAYQFLEAFRDSFLFQQVTEPTHTRLLQKPNVLDLIISNEEGVVTNLHNTAPIG